MKQAGFVWQGALQLVFPSMIITSDRTKSTEFIDVSIYMNPVMYQCAV